MKYHIHKAVVIGSGTMGAAIAAHLANIGVPVTLLDIVAKDSDDKNKIVKEGWDRCLKAKPANLMSSELKTLVKLGNLEDDFGAVAEADWVCEAIIENLKIKVDLMTRIDEVRKPHAIVSTNTSGIPVKDIAEGRSDGFKQHFLGTHFFNPPRYLKLLEIIPTADTSKEVTEFFVHFGEFDLGKWLGNKTKVGFYKEARGEDGKKEFHSLDLNTLEHVPAGKPRFDSVKAAKDVEGLGDRLRVFLAADDKAAKLVKALTYQSFQYVSSIIPEVADTAKPIDDAMRWGFMHEAGPFEIWDMLGVKETVKRMKAEGYPAAKWVDEMLKNGVETFYQYKGGNKVGAYDVSKKKYVKLKQPEGFVFLKDLRGTKKMIAENAGASMFDIGDGVALVEFHTKMNALDDDIFNITTEALDRVENDFDGLVIGNEGEHFSAGANLFMVVVASQQGMWDTLDGAIRKLQGMNMRMRYFPKPVVVAPAGMALGGGCEVTMHASRVVAAAETYIGLVELGAGVI
ncbi:MAG: 3-hydroxyacyl-CoA dehydrogenase/enoyl-CoA hydratase family protein, partial [Anaerolineales bacterium]|nr:3-hydroxyacyl-CoA dehydrogenase/enoyl-CoA hydratase family protein [Anaerolineales bacterium]